MRIHGLDGLSRAVVCVVVGAVLAAPACAGEYAGLFFHRFTGSDEGSEWSTWGPRTGVGRYEFADLPALGRYPGTIAPGGSFVLDNGRGTGMFTSEDEGDIHFTLGGGLAFESHIRRAPYTDASFPVFLTTTVDGDGGLGGQWRARVCDVDPETGATLGESTQVWGVAVEGSTIRVTRADGEYLQGAWASTTQAAFRVIEPNPRLARYQTFAGSETSLELDTIGELRVLGENAMTLAVFFQTRSPFGEQVQSMQYVEFTRVPAPAGSAAIVLGVLGCGVRRRR